MFDIGVSARIGFPMTLVREWIQLVTFQLHNLYKYLNGLSGNKNL